MGRLRTLPDALAEAARADAGYVFVSGGTETFRSFADIRAASVKTSRALREAGLRSGDLVALVLGEAEAFSRRCSRPRWPVSFRPRFIHPG